MVSGDFHFKLMVWGNPAGRPSAGPLVSARSPGRGRRTRLHRTGQLSLGIVGRASPVPWASFASSVCEDLPGLRNGARERLSRVGRRLAPGWNRAASFTQSEAPGVRRARRGACPQSRALVDTADPGRSQQILGEGVGETP